MQSIGNNPTLKIVKCKTYKTLLCKILKIYERDHYENRFQSCRNNLKKSWDIIREVINKCKTKPIQHKFNVNGRVTNDEMTIAERFNTFSLILEVRFQTNSTCNS